VSSNDAPGLESPQSLAQRLGVPFSDMRLFRRALTHRSYLNEHPEAMEDNERLEFLGDAILDFVVGAWLYNHFPEMSEGEMTRLRAALVSTEHLGALGRQIAIGPALRMGHGEEESGGRARLAMLCNAFEAIVGAIYLDGGIPSVQSFLEPLLSRSAMEILKGEGDRDPKSLLQEWVQAQGSGAPVYRIVSESGPDHSKFFEVEVVVGGRPLARGDGRSKQAASKVAAKAALKALEQNEV
jgi:ribonuclease-3